MIKNSLFDYRIILLFCLITSLPMLSYQGKYHGDEKFYTDAAYRMIQTGDYMTPYYSTGELRFRKPILNYWFIVASYKLLGVNQFSARFVQLLFAIGTLWLVFFIGKHLYDKEAGLLAMVIYMSNIQFIKLSTCSMTDMPLAFFMGLSVLGFVRIFFLQQTHWTNLCLFYCGGALAVSTKGGFGGWFVLYALGYACVSYVTVKKTRSSPTIFLHFPMLIVAAGIASFWYIAVWLKHGDEAIVLFFNDQVGERFIDYKSVFLLQILENAFDYLKGFLIEFLPWLLFFGIVIVKDRETIRQCIRKHGEIICFASGWILALVFPLLFANRSSLRWIFPGYLLISIMFGVILRYFARNSKIVSLSAFSHTIIAIGAILLGIVVSVLAIGISWRVSLGAAVIAVVCFTTLQLIKTRDTYFQLVCLALLIFSVIRINDLIMLPEFFRPPAPELFKFLRTHVTDKTPNVAFVTGPKGFRFPSLLRIVSRGTMDITLIPESSTLSALNNEFDVIIRYPPLTIENDLDDYVRTTNVFGYWNWKGKHIFPIFLRMQSKEDVFAEPNHSLEFEVLVQKNLWRD